MNKNMYDTLDKFFADRTIQDIDRSVVNICNLKDGEKKITISLVFLRDWDSLEVDSYSCIVMEPHGAVFTFPCYWLAIPKELAMTYMENIIDNFYLEEVNRWNTGGMITDDGNSGNQNGCGCPIPPPPPQTPSCRICT